MALFSFYYQNYLKQIFKLFQKNINLNIFHNQIPLENYYSQPELFDCIFIIIFSLTLSTFFLTFFIYSFSTMYFSIDFLFFFLMITLLHFEKQKNLILKQSVVYFRLHIVVSFLLQKMKNTS